jgi:hypothetical protein
MRKAGTMAATSPNEQVAETAGLPPESDES